MKKLGLLRKYSANAVADVLSCFGLPTSTASQIYSDILEKRNSDALEIFFSEVRQGHFENVDQYEAISIVARFQRDAMEGVARSNLQLMARTVRGMADKEELRASSFLKYANILANLTLKEIRVLGVMIKYLDAPKGWNSEAYKDYQGFGISEESIIQQALLRTGLVMMEIGTEAETSDLKSIGMLGNDKPKLGLNSWISFSLSRLMIEIMKYTDFGDL